MTYSWLTRIDRSEHSDQLGFTYVQGMNVLAAPFLYSLPSELEAFWCFTRFIEERCPLYVQPTLEGVHRGLGVRTAQDGRSKGLTVRTAAAG
jgi:cell cycle arrest protein BUB2